MRVPESPRGAVIGHLPLDHGSISDWCAQEGRCWCLLPQKRGPLSQLGEGGARWSQGAVDGIGVCVGGREKDLTGDTLGSPERSGQLLSYLAFSISTHTSSVFERSCTRDHTGHSATIPPKVYIMVLGPERPVFRFPFTR